MNPARKLVTTTTTALLLALVGCTDTDTDPATGADTSASDADTTTSSSDPLTPSASGELVQATRLAEVAPDTALRPGRYAMNFSSDQDDVPMVLIDVPPGYSGSGDEYEFLAEEDDGAAFRHFDTWTVAEVATQPCGDTARWVDPGPSVDDLADALAALPVWETTQPVPRTIGGQKGVFMELNVPANLPAKCHGDLLSWRDHVGGTQGIGTGKTQRLWIVDVDGHRLVMIAGYFPGPEGPTPRQVDELTQIAESATFLDSDQIAP